MPWMADHSKPVTSTRLRAVRELEFQMSRREFAKKINDTGRAMGENVAAARAWSQTGKSATSPVPAPSTSAS